MAAYIIYTVFIVLILYLLLLIIFKFGFWKGFKGSSFYIKKNLKLVLKCAAVQFWFPRALYYYYKYWQQNILCNTGASKMMLLSGFLEGTDSQLKLFSKPYLLGVQQCDTSITNNKHIHFSFVTSVAPSKHKIWHPRKTICARVTAVSRLLVEQSETWVHRVDYIRHSQYHTWFDFGIK